jgi:hypothetical protein
VSDKHAQMREMARDLIRNSVIEDAIAQRIAQIIEFIHEDRIKPLEAKLAKAVKDLKGWLEVSQHCTIEDGVCCCGEAMKGHANPMSCGHSPVDYGAYAAKRLAESTRATLAEIEGDKP